jgi:purine-nucleoside phosphorylase
MKEDLAITTNYLKEKGFDKPEIGIILGTGLGKLVEHITIEVEISYNHIPHFPTATVEFHQGKFIYGELAGKKVVVMQGRFHLYEGYSLQDVTFPVRIMKELGIQKLLVSNAAGAINKNYKKGELMLIDDHINMQGGSPLAFKGVSQFGERFVDMLAPYDADMNAKFKDIAKENNITLHEGVYASVVGPQLETRAEYRYLGIIGADAVGMSTVPEVIVANHMEIEVLGISCITNMAAGVLAEPLKHEDVVNIAEKVKPEFIKLLQGILKEISVM